MQTHRSKRVAEKPGLNDPTKLDVVLMHEDLPAGLRGKQALDQLADQLGTEFCLHLWRLDLMKEHALRRLAIEEARQANILVLALRHCTQLPAAVRAWFQQWLECRRPGPCAIVVSLDSEARALPTPHPVMQYLRGVSEAAGVDLFQHYGDTLPAAWNVRQTIPSAVAEKTPYLTQLHAA